MSNAATPDRTMAVAIAKDVIAQIRRADNPLRIAAPAGYCHGVMPAGLPATGDVRDHVEQIQAHCHVCMLGGLFLSKSRVFDDSPLASINRFDRPDTIHVDRGHMVAQLSAAFTPDDLDAIEAAFELIGGTSEYDGDDADEAARRERRCFGAARWALDKGDRRGRAVAIAENIIANGGEFVVTPCDRHAFWNERNARDVIRFNIRHRDAHPETPYGVHPMTANANETPMTRAAMTAAIARDILDQIRRPDDVRPRFKTGSYIAGVMPRLDTLDGVDLRDHADAVQAHCTVCMLGAALISKARLFDRVPLNGVASLCSWDDVTRIGAGRRTTTDHLADAIEPATMDAMEAAFEADVDPVYGHGDVTDDVRGAAMFGRQWDDPTRRAVAILENVVAHGGRLVVPPVAAADYVPVYDDDDDFDDDRDDDNY